jgi:hypothetical protein
MSDNYHEEKPPVFKSWRGWYWVVLGALALQILFYYWLTNSFNS